MHWAMEAAQNIVDKYPDKDIYTLASGISPSGFIHIGNLREVLTTYFVVRALNLMGKKTRFLLSFDDYDRLRKVPSGFSESLNASIGLPYCQVNSPFIGSEGSYATDLENLFIDELAMLGVDVEYIYQSKKYLNGDYVAEIIFAMNHRLSIYDILLEYKTQEPNEDERNQYYPITVYCSHCHKDTTTIHSYDKETDIINYSCQCGNHEEVSLKNYHHVKLQWKVDWPMRWKYEDVIFEPGGRDHSSVTGSYRVSSDISKKIFDYEPPLYIKYDFIGIKGSHLKMSSSTGDVLTTKDLLNVYSAPMLLWMYAKPDSKAAFNIALDLDVIKNYAEFDRFVKSYQAHKLEGIHEDIFRLINLDPNYMTTPDFSNIVSILPSVNFNYERTLEILGLDTHLLMNEFVVSRLDKATYWIKNYGEGYHYSLLHDPNVDYYNQLNEEEKMFIEHIKQTLPNINYVFEDIQNMLYATAKINETDEKMFKPKQKRLFEILYFLLIGRNKGPKLGLFIASNSIEDIINLLSF